MVAGLGYAPCVLLAGSSQGPEAVHPKAYPGGLGIPLGYNMLGMHEYQLWDHVYLLLRYYKIPAYLIPLIKLQ